MMADPFDVLAKSIDAKSNLRLVQVKVLGQSPTGYAQVSMRGATLSGVPVTGPVPATNALMWMLVDDGVMLGLT